MTINIVLFAVGVHLQEFLTILGAGGIRQEANSVLEIAESAVGPCSSVMFWQWLHRPHSLPLSDAYIVNIDLRFFINYYVNNKN